MRALGDDVGPTLAEDPDDAFADDRRVIGDDHSHGSQTSSVVPAPGGLSMRNVPFSALTRSSNPLDPDPADASGAPDPVVPDPDGEAAVASARR